MERNVINQLIIRKAKDKLPSMVTGKLVFY